MYFKFCPSPLKSPFPFCLLLFLRFLLRLIIDVVLFVAFLLFLRIFYLFGRFFEFVLRKPILLYSSYKAKKPFTIIYPPKIRFIRFAFLLNQPFPFWVFVFLFLRNFFFQFTAFICAFFLVFLCIFFFKSICCNFYSIYHLSIYFRC